MNVIKKLTTEDVLSVYSGKNGRCCCGCAGEHYDGTLYQKETGRKVSDRMVKKVCRIINEAIDSGEAENGGNNISTVIGERLYICYLISEKEKKEWDLKQKKLVTLEQLKELK